jgi:hypothetical protein
VKKIGARWFVTPGPIGSAGGGLAVVDDEGEEVTVAIYDSAGKPGVKETLATQRAAKIKVQGGEG